VLIGLPLTTTDEWSGSSREKVDPPNRAQLVEVSRTNTCLSCPIPGQTGSEFGQPTRLLSPGSV
jgi:hypothetical protein